MHRLFLAGTHTDKAELEVGGREAHHALHVMRVGRGDEAVVLDGAGGEYACEVREAGRHSLKLQVMGWKVTERQPCQVTLIQALPKGKAFEMILEKATELGAYRIVPLITERVVARAEKLEKWRWVMIDAMKQCGNPWMPVLDAPHRFADALRRVEEFDVNLVGSLDVAGARRNPGQWLKGVRNVAVWIGPEGDFTPQEMNALRNAGVREISLGRLVLRSDTAAISSLAIINYELDIGG